MLLTEPAEELRGEAQVRSNHVLRDPLFDLWVPFNEFEVAFFGGFTVGRDNALLQDNKRPLHQNPEEGVELGNLPVELLHGVKVNLDNFGVLQGLYVVISRRLGEKAPQIGNPPVFKGKLHYVLLSVVINVKGPETAFYYKGFVLAYGALLHNVLAFADFPIPQKRGEKCFFLI